MEFFTCSKHNYSGIGTPCPDCDNGIKPQLCDGWRDARRETPTNGESYLIWIYGGSDERNEGYIIDGCFVDGMYFAADGLSVNAVAWMKRPAPPAFA